MKSRIAKIGGAGSAFLLAIFVASYWMAGEIDEDRYLPLIAIAGELRQLTTRWNTELSHVKSNTDANFDGLVEIKSDIRRLETDFQEATSLIPDLPEQVSTAAHAYVSAITAKQQRVERFTRSYALVDTSKQILLLARMDVIRIAHAEDEQEVAWAVMDLLGELDAFLYQPSEETRRSAGASLEALSEALSVESAGYSEPLDAALKTLLSHAGVLLERYLHTEALFAEALSDDASERGGALLDELEQLVSGARAMRKLYEFAMAGTVAIWLGMWIVLALRARRRVSEDIPTRSYAEDSSEAIHTTQQRVERHEPAEPGGVGEFGVQLRRFPRAGNARGGVIRAREARGARRARRDGSHRRGLGGEPDAPRRVRRDREAGRGPEPLDAGAQRAGERGRLGGGPEQDAHALDHARRCSRGHRPDSKKQSRRFRKYRGS